MNSVSHFFFWYKMSKSSNINTFCCHVETWITNPGAHVPTQNIKKKLNYTMRKTN